MKALFRRIFIASLTLMMTASLAGPVFAEEITDVIQEGITDVAIEENADVAPEEIADVILEETAAAETSVDESPEEISSGEKESEEVFEEIVVSDVIFIEESVPDPIEETIFQETVIQEEVSDPEEPALIPVLEEETVEGGIEEIILTDSITDEITEEENIFDDSSVITLDRELILGTMGYDVYYVQKRLEELGFMYSGSADGVYGKYTEYSIKLFQAEAGLYPYDGVVGYWTLQALNNRTPAFYTLTYGQYSNAVVLLQEALISQGYLDSWADGYYGNMTVRAVKLFQASNGMKVTGEADLSTILSVLAGNGSMITMEPLRIGSQGAYVVTLQKRLNELGYYYNEADGDFGRMTETAVIMFQALNGFANPTGVVDVDTYVALIEDSNSFYTLTPGTTSTAVAVMQKYLIEMEYMSGAPYGTFDQATLEALMAFQYKNGLYVDGVPGIQTLSVLFNINAAVPMVEYNLSLGSKSEAVYNIQQKLYQLGFLKAVPDGNFERWTYAAVCAFQAANGNYYPDGIVDTALYRQILKATTPFTYIYKQSPESEIYAIQYVLYTNQFISTCDGVYGDLTWEAVGAIQKMFGLTSTGVVDAYSLYYIYNYSSLIGNRYNVQNYYSNTNWLIFVNVTTNRMYVYYGSRGNWNLVYNWPCSCGAEKNPTVIGEFTTDYRGYSFTDGETYTCYYYTSFYGPYYMHSTLYKLGTWEVLDDRLGLNLSHGCIRLETENAYWIWTNIPLGTKVVTVR